MLVTFINTRHLACCENKQLTNRLALTSFTALKMSLEVTKLWLSKDYVLWSLILTKLNYARAWCIACNTNFSKPVFCVTDLTLVKKRPVSLLVPRTRLQFVKAGREERVEG